MNLLAHCALSGRKPLIMVGNFIGDHIKGRHLAQLHPAVAQGVWLHRAIDHFTDQHPATKAAAPILRPIAGRYAYPALDVVFDHLLARQWPDFYAQPLPAFAQWCYQVLQAHEAHLPPRVRRFLPYMIRQNWLLNYRSRTGLGHALHGLARRASNPVDFQPILGLPPEHWLQLEAAFAQLYPEVRRMSCQYLSDSPSLP